MLFRRGYYLHHNLYNLNIKHSAIPLYIDLNLLVGFIVMNLKDIIQKLCLQCYLFILRTKEVTLAYNGPLQLIPFGTESTFLFVFLSQNIR